MGSTYELIAKRKLIIGEDDTSQQIINFLGDEIDEGDITNVIEGNRKFRYSATIENPISSEDFYIGFTNRAITATEMRCVLRGSSTPSVTWTVRHSTDRNATGNEIVTGGTTTTSTTTGSDVTTFNDATIPADSFIWLETTAKSGTVNELGLTILGDVDYA